MPKLSIVVSTYNRGKTYLKPCIESILSQDFKDYELIIIDDFSRDNTEHVVSGFDDNRIVYKKRLRNFGSDTRPKNEGAELASGTYLMFVDDDVKLRPGALSKLLSTLEEKPELDVVYGDMWILPKNEAGIAHDFDHQLLLLRNFIDTSSAMMKRSVFMDVGGFDETLSKFVDWNLWVRISKYGAKFHRVHEITFDYYLHEDRKSNRIKTETYMHPNLGMIFVPTFNPSGCEIVLDYTKKHYRPKVAIFTIHMDRIAYSKESYREMRDTAGYKFDWFPVDNGSKDGTAEWLKTLNDTFPIILDRNMGITGASNLAIDAIKASKEQYDLIIKIDNDIEFQTHGWLSDIVNLWKRNRMLYVSPYVEGLIENAGGAPRMGYGFIGDDFVEVTGHIGGLFSAIDAKAYNAFRWKDKMLHGSQDVEASMAFRKMGYMPMYYPRHRVTHKDTRIGQIEKYPEYFQRRKKQKEADHEA